MLQKNEARQRRYQDQDWEEVISIYVGRRSRKNVWRYLRRVGNTAGPDHDETTVLCWVASRIAAPRKPKMSSLWQLETTYVQSRRFLQVG